MRKLVGLISVMFVCNTSCRNNEEALQELTKCNKCSVELESITYIDSSKLYPQTCDVIRVEKDGDHEHARLENGKVINFHWEYSLGNNVYYTDETGHDYRIIASDTVEYYRADNLELLHPASVAGWKIIRILKPHD